MEAQPFDIETRNGALRGIQGKGVLTFKGVPYAASPTGPLRFRPPQPVERWSGLHDATQYAPSAVQDNPLRVARRAPEEHRATHLERLEWETGLWGTPVDIDDVQDENCLTLNIWTSGLASPLRPVMVWFHGGGWIFGSASAPWSDSANLASRHDVVVVTVNHRLGALGYLNLAERGDSRYETSAYAGVLDLVESFRWVHDNIAGFGGDPANVTLFGQSGGGEKVLALLALPQARGLFHRAIVQSSAAGSTFLSWDRSLQLADEVMAELDVADVDELERVPTEVMLDARRAVASRVAKYASDGSPTQPRRLFMEGIVFSPALPGLSPATAIETLASSSLDVPLLIGTTLDEALLMHPGVADPGLTYQQAVDAARAIIGPLAAQLMDAYRTDRPSVAPNDLLLAYLSDHIYRIASTRFAANRAAAGADVYTYLLSWSTPAFTGKPQAPHCLDIPLVFDNVAGVPCCAQVEDHQALAQMMSGAWTTFARTGAPGHTAMPAWPRYEPCDRATMTMAGNCAVTRDPFRDVRRAWRAIPDSAVGVTGELAD